MSNCFPVKHVIVSLSKLCLAVMSNDLPLSALSVSEQLSHLKLKAQNKQVTNAEATVWRQACGRSARRNDTLLPPFPVIRISSTSASAKVQERELQYARNAPSKFIAALKKKLDGCQKGKKAQKMLVGQLVFWRRLHAQLFFSGRLQYVVPQLHRLEVSLAPDARWVKQYQLWKKLVVEAKVAPTEPKVASTAVAEENISRERDYQRVDCFSAAGKVKFFPAREQGDDQVLAAPPIPQASRCRAKGKRKVKPNTRYGSQFCFN